MPCMAMAELTSTAFVQSQSHHRLAFLRSSEPWFLHAAARSDLLWLRFFPRPLWLRAPQHFCLQLSRFPNSKICCDVSDARGSGSGNELDLEQGDAVSWIGANIRESLADEQHDFSRHKKVDDLTDCSISDTENSKVDSLRISRRGRTKKTIAFPDDDVEEHSEVDHIDSIRETTSKSQVFTEERDSDTCKPSSEPQPSHKSKTTKNTRNHGRFEEWKSIISENKYFRKSIERDKDGSKDESHNEIRARVQELINADLDRKFHEESDDENCPLWVDEDDPNWLEEPDDGWGFRVSDFFIEKATKIRSREGHNGADILDWDLEPEKWSAKEIDFTDWTDTVFGDPTPLVVLLFDRYGNRARESYHALRELEAAANRIWDSHRLPPRLVKINASVEVDLVSALRVKEFPMLLFIRAGKLLHRQSGYHTADDLMRMIAYFYHGAGRPSCLKSFQAPESVPRN